MGGGQPSVHGIHTGFGAVADDRQKRSDTEQAFMTGDFGGVQNAACRETDGIRGKLVENEHAKKPEQGAADRIKQIFQAGGDGRGRLFMQDQGHGAERRQLKGEIRRHQVGGTADGDQGSERNKIEGEKRGVPFLDAHIDEGIEQGQRVGQENGHEEPFADRVK